MFSLLNRFTSKFEPERNPLKIATAIGLALILAIETLLYYFAKWPFPLLWDMTNTVISTVGGLLLAAGVYMSRTDQKRLIDESHPGMLAAIAISGAKSIPLGISYLVVGAASQMIHSALTAFGKFAP